MFVFFFGTVLKTLNPETFIVRLSVERVIELSCPQRSSFPAASATAADGLGKAFEARRRCTTRRSSATSRLQSFCSQKGPWWTPRRTMARGLRGRAKSRLHNLRHFGGFPSLEILRKMVEFSANVVQNREFPALNMQKMLGSMITCSVLII